MLLSGGCSEVRDVKRGRLEERKEEEEDGVGILVSLTRKLSED